MFIDATYEGDLMALAGVKFAVGREANKTYGETYNGVQIVKSMNKNLVTVENFTANHTFSFKFANLEAGGRFNCREIKSAVSIIFSRSTPV